MSDIDLCGRCGFAFCLDCAPESLEECAGGDQRLECDECRSECAPCLAAARDNHAAEVALDNALEGPW